MSSLLEPLIMAILGVLVGGLVIAMYLPIFKLGAWSEPVALTKRRARAAFSYDAPAHCRSSSARPAPGSRSSSSSACWSAASSTSSSIAFRSCWSASGARRRSEILRDRQADAGTPPKPDPQPQVQPGRAALRLSEVRRDDHGGAEHSGHQLPVAQGQVRELRRAASRCAIRSSSSARRSSPRWSPGSSASSGTRARRSLLTWVLIALTRHRHRSSAAARQHDAAAGVARPAAQPRADDPVDRTAGRSALQHHRCGGRLSEPVERLSRVPPAHRQGRHGLRRLQAVRRARRVARLADAAADHPAVRVHRRRGRHPHDRAARP